MALEREYSQLTVISPERRKLLGYLDVPLVMEQLDSRPQAKGQEEDQERGDELLVKDVYTKFDRRKSVGYTVITPDTSLDILEDFLKDQKFAIGTYSPQPRIPLRAHFPCLSQYKSILSDFSYG